MIPRKKIDIGWSDLSYGLMASFSRKKLTTLNLSSNHSLATLSVRSGFDLILQCLSLPKGSEILVSAITIRDMIKIIEFHHLHAIPIDIDPETCSIQPDALAQAITPQTKAILIAHLFGSRMPMDALIDIAHKNNLYVFEDCAQAYMADRYWGHPSSDFVLFSFGTIKTATALGGGLIFFKEKVFFDKAVQLHQQYQVQSRITFLRRVIKYSAIKILSYKATYSVFIMLIKMIGKSHDKIISQMVRGFAGENLIQQIRFRPSHGLLLLLERRLRLYTIEHINNRKNIGIMLTEFLSGIPAPGKKATNHSYWVFPIMSENPDNLIKYLWTLGIDATRGASSLYAVPVTTSTCHLPVNAIKIISHIVYLPIYHGISPSELRKISSAVIKYESMQEAHVRKLY